VWDLGGQTSIRPYWRCYYPNTDAVIFVVDSADVERMKIAKQELMAMLEVVSLLLLVVMMKRHEMVPTLMPCPALLVCIYPLS